MAARVRSDLMPVDDELDLGWEEINYVRFEKIGSEMSVVAHRVADLKNLQVIEDLNRIVVCHCEWTDGSGQLLPTASPAKLLRWLTRLAARCLHSRWTSDLFVDAAVYTALR